MTANIADITTKITSLDPGQIQILPLANNIGEGNLLTATKISTAYNIPAATGANVKIGIISLGGGFSQTDINNSLSDLGLTAPTINFVGVDGATNSYTSNVANTEYSGTLENTLDIVCIAGMVPSANITVYKGLNQGIYFDTSPASAKTLNLNSSFGNTIQQAVDDNCDIISISWGTTETREILGNTYYCGDYLDGPFADASANNISVFVASGDYGSSALGNTQITGNIVCVDYPSVNANVTAVGGTYLTLNVGNTRVNETVYNNSEVGLPGFGGGGGVSSMVSLPSYQANLTYTDYPSNSISSLSTRGIPDISAAMNAYGIWLNGNVYGVSGTSASAPIMAGMVARFISLNGGRRPPSGSAGLNKIFYQSSDSFYDITTGNNASLLATGYSATAGWDAVAGLGAQTNATATYQSVTSAGTKIKDSGGNWQDIANVFVKQSGTWNPVEKIWVKDSGTWKQVY